MADRVSFSFAGGETQMVPGSYIEFAERLVLPQYKDLMVSRVCLLWVGGGGGWRGARKLH